MNVDQARELARELIVFCDGIEEGGQPEFARRGRAVARECLRALDELEAERSARQAIQATRDGLLELLMARGFERDEALMLADEPGPAQ